MSFGLGYFEDGVWVDHSTPGTAVPETAGENILPPPDAPLDVVHLWFTCCSDPATTQRHVAVLSEMPPGETLRTAPSAAWDAPMTRRRASQR